MNFSRMLRRTLVFTGSILLTIICVAQSQKSETLVKSWNNYHQHFVEEKLYAHVDRSTYAAGEIIWFKLYDLDGIGHRFLDISKLAYVELISKEGKAVLQGKIALKDGMGNGSFLIPFSLTSGNYLFRAYTSWMKNFPPELYYEKPITILNAQRKPDSIAVFKQNEYDVQFFPEGGNLVFGLPGNIGFRIVDQFGKDADCVGTVFDSNNDTVAHFRPLKFGLGHFILNPVKGKEYSAAIQMKDGQRIVKPLPKAIERGYSMMVSQQDSGRLLITVSSNTGDPEGAIYLFAQTRSVAKTVMQSKLKEGKGAFQLQKELLGEGISSLTIFNDQLQPVCERLFFQKPKRQLQIKLRPGKENYDLRQRVSVDLTADDLGKPAEGEFSVAIFLQDSLQNISGPDINDWLWLNSEIKGNVESPSYYLSSDPQAADAVDNLMLTQGWRKIHWDDITQGKAPIFEFVPEYDGQIINGKIIDRRSGNPVPGTPVYLSIPGEKYSLNISTSNEKGELRYEVRRFYGPGELVLQANGKGDSIYRIDILNPFSEKFSGRSLPSFPVYENSVNEFLFRTTHAQVENHFLSDKKQQFVSYKAPDSLAFYGLPDKKYFLDDYTRFVTMEEVMREYVTLVRVRKNNEIFRFTVFDVPHNYFFENEPMILLDGIPVFDLNKIMAFDPLKMKKIEIVARRYYLDSVINEGIISYSTYKGDLGGFKLDPSSIILEWNGLQYEREFFSPVYETSDLAAGRIPDFRHLLYWNPTARTDSTGKLTFNFYSSDLPGKYIIVTEGIAPTGIAGRGTSSFIVSKSR
jgi:hypothetical protein